MTDADATMGDAQPSSRLMITKMVLENFKSYGGVREIGPFHKRFSSVVGANLCGNQPVREVDELPRLRGQRRVDGVEPPRHRADAVTGDDVASMA